MRWQWRRQPPAVNLARAGRLPDGRLVDGDTVRGPGQARWADLLAGPAALTEDTAVLPVVTPAQEHRGRGGGWSCPT